VPLESLSGRRVLVTGVSGFVGDHLARTLTRRGADVWGAGAEPDSVPSACTEGTVNGYRAGLDVSDARQVLDLVAWSEPGAIVHLAGQSSAGKSFEDPVGTFRANVVGTWNLLEAVRSAAPKARVLLIGSGESYGPQPEGSRVSEDAPFQPVSPYAFSKAAADAMAELYGATHGLDIVRTRSFGHTGPGQSPRFVIPSFAQQIAAIERGASEPVLRVGNLEVTRDLSDVRDIAEAYATLLERGRSGGAYNVGSGRGTRLADAVRALAELAHVAVRIEVDPSRVRPADVSYLVGDIGRISEETGWQPSVPFAQTLADVLDEWRSTAAA
jgi:GDP-4-dehydro-6-deoxy-D-mannose reductase